MDVPRLTYIKELIIPLHDVFDFFICIFLCLCIVEPDNCSAKRRTSECIYICGINLAEEI